MAFRKDGLKKCDWQYQVIHQSIKCFKIGEKVFLNSGSPVLIVIGFINGEVEVQWKDKNSNNYTHTFKPQQILQYKYAGLMLWKDKYKINLN